ncbi:MAG: hypothetical protein AAF401_11795 [Pseudomonadota bacterium]
MGANWISGARDVAGKAASRLSALTRLRTLTKGDDLVIQAAHGGSDAALIVFNSLHAKTAGDTPAEFLATASNAGERHVIFVTDPLQRWFQGRGVARRTTKVISEYLADIGAALQLTLGVSMGGYAAAVFAGRLGARAALCIGAQYDVGPGSPEKCWKEQRAAIDKFRLGPAGDHLDGSAAITTIHGGRDSWHSAQFASHPGVSAWMAPTRKHNVAGLLKDRGLLAPLVHATAQNDVVGIEGVMRRFNAERVSA